MRKSFFRILIAVLAIALLCSCTSSKPSYIPKKNTTVSLGVSSLTMVPGESHTFSPTFKNAEKQPLLVWTSSDENVLKVDQNGTVTAENTDAGNKSAQITASLSDNPNMRSICTITVLSPAHAHFVTAGPGQDASTQAVISWHSTHSSSTIEYTDADGNEFSNSLKLDGIPTESGWADLSSVFRYRAVLQDLVPASTYRYRIITPGSDSAEISEFRTAGKDGSFSFAWLSDVHASSADSMDNIKALLDFADGKADISFCLFSGDMINHGNRYRYWEGWSESGLLKDMQYAFVIGNHEYYIYDSPQNATNSYYIDFVAIPDNHGNTPSSDFWFIYDNVLFICLDTMAAEFSKTDVGSPVLEAQGEWFQDVVRQNEGKYTFLVAVQHYAFLDGDVEGTGNYSFWYPIFGRCGVDLALSSDTHTYSRSKTLFNDRPAESGTVYITSPMTEGKSLSLITNDDSRLGERSAFNSAVKVMGGSYIDVTPDSMTVHVIGQDGTEFDSVSILR